MKPAKTIKLKTSDGIQLSGLHYQSESPEPKATVIVIHGFTANVAQEELQALLAALNSSDVNLIACDSRGHGESEGESTFGIMEIYDLDAVVNLALEENAPILLVGISMGAAAAFNYLTKCENARHIDGLLSVSSPALWRTQISLSSLWVAFLTRTKTGRRILSERHKVRIAMPIKFPSVPPAEIARNLKLPISVVGGTQDMLFGSKAAHLIYSQAGGPKHLELAYKSGHGPSAALLGAIVRGYEWLIDEVLVVQSSKSST